MPSRTAKLLKRVGRSAFLFVVTSVLAYVALSIWERPLSQLFATIANESIWAVALTLTVSVAMFTNMLRIYDEIGKAVRDRKDASGGSPLPQFFEKALSKTDGITQAMLGNTLLAILSGLAIAILRALRDIAAPSNFPDWVWTLRPPIVNVATEVGFAAVVLAILLNQFATIPPLIAMYRFFAIERHTPVIAPSTPVPSAVNNLPQSPSKKIAR